MEQRRIFLVHDNDKMRAELRRLLCELGCSVTTASSRTEARALLKNSHFDLIISDLRGDSDIHESREPEKPSSNSEDSRAVVKAFKIAAAAPKRSESCNEICNIVEKVLDYKLHSTANGNSAPAVRKKIDLELPSNLSLMNIVLSYLVDRVAKLGVINPETSNLFVALDEAFVNAVKHGNRNDPCKLVRIAAELSATEARITIEDQGEGFDVKEIPDPCDPDNLFKASGRGVLLIYNIMDKVEYNERGNRLTMVKKSEEALEKKLVESSSKDDSHRHS